MPIELGVISIFAIPSCFDTMCIVINIFYTIANALVTFNCYIWNACEIQDFLGGFLHNCNITINLLGKGPSSASLVVRESSFDFIVKKYKGTGGEDSRPHG